MCSRRIMNNLIKKKYDEQSTRILLKRFEIQNNKNNIYNNNNNDKRKNKTFVTSTKLSLSNKRKEVLKLENNRNTMPQFFSKSDKLPLLFDVDCNLTHKDLIEDVNEHVESAIKIGVAGMIVPSMTIAEAMECLKIYEKFNTKEFKIRTTIGIHPYTANEFNTTNNTINEMKNIILENPCITAIGECGLDYSDGFPDKSIQLPCFEEQLKLSCELKMPLYIHHRGAFDDFVDLMDKYHDRLNDVKILIHCFTGDEKELEWILNQPNYFISFSGYICKPKHGEILRNLLIQQRKDNNKNTKLLKRMMIETDAPYLGFPNCRMYTNGNAKSKRKQYPNVPTSLPYIVKTLSTCLNIDEETIAIETKKNAEMFFNIVG